MNRDIISRGIAGNRLRMCGFMMSKIPFCKCPLWGLRVTRCQAIQRRRTGHDGIQLSVEDTIDPRNPTQAQQDDFRKFPGLSERRS